MATKLSATDERALMASVRDVDSLVTAGMSPTDAVIKVARDARYDDGRIRILCTAYNAGKQLTHFDSGSNAFEKLSSFALAEPDVAIAGVYRPQPSPEPRVSSQYMHGPDAAWRNAEKHAAWDAEVAQTAEKRATEKVAPKVSPADELWTTKAARNRVGQLLVTAEQQWMKVSHDLFNYFKQPAMLRCSVPEAKLAAQAWGFDEMIPFLDGLEENFVGPEKRAAAMGHASTDQVVRKFANCRQAGEAYLAAQKAVDIMDALVKEARDRAYPAAPRPQVPCTRSIIPGDSEDPFRKRANLLNSPALGSAMGVTLSRSLQPILGVEDRDTQAVIDRFDDPNVDAEIRRARTQAALTRIMTDPDDPLSKQDPRRIVDIYNQLAQVAPRAASQSILLGPLLRRQASGLSDPFEAGQLLSIERGLGSGGGPPQAPR